MVITDFLEKNARLYGEDVALVEINPSEERDRAVTWRDFSLIENTRPDLPYRRDMTWGQFDKKAGHKGRHSADELPGMAAHLFRRSEGRRHRRSHELPLFR